MVCAIDLTSESEEESNEESVVGPNSTIQSKLYVTVMRTIIVRLVMRYKVSGLFVVERSVMGDM